MNLNHSGTLSFRNQGLDPSDIPSIMETVIQSNISKPVRSISFSYNRLIGDAGIIAIVNNLPSTVIELGLVDCGIGDYGGKILLEKIKTLTNLKMLCVEENNFSDSMKQEFKVFSHQNPPILMVV